MINNISTFIAQKYLKFKHKDRNISLMIKICFLGIFIGTFSLMLTLIIMHGFEKTIHEKMQGINSQAIIYSPGNKLDYDSIKTVLMQEFSSNIESITASSIRQILIDRNNKQSVLFVKGVDPINEGKVTNIEQKIILPQKKLLETMLQENQIIIGTKTAQNYGLKIGDKIDLLIPEPSSKKKIFLNKKQAVVAGIFKIGLEEYDNNFAFCSLDFLQKLFDEKKGVDQISLKLKKTQKSFLFSGNSEEQIIKKIQQRMPMLIVCSWKDLYPALVSSLKLEKYVMFFILALITLVACMTMISLLFMYIQQKRRDIAILTAMGLSNRKIRFIFLKIGLLITFLGSIFGLAFAALAGYLLEKYPFIELPDVYYISYLPARMEPELFIIVFLVTMFLGFLATWIPAQRTRKIKVAQVLRQE
jgi:lipoprotein releasing system LolC/E family transmembrane protein